MHPGDRRNEGQAEAGPRDTPCRVQASEAAQCLGFSFGRYARPFIGQADKDDICETSYRDRGGKYQGQTGVTLPRT